MRIAIAGSDSVGLVSGARFADFSHTVCCVNQDAVELAQPKRREVSIFEPEWDAFRALDFAHLKNIVVMLAPSDMYIYRPNAAGLHV